MAGMKRTHERQHEQDRRKNEMTNDTITPELLDKYFAITEEAIRQAKAAKKKKGAEICIDMAERYVSDAHHFRDKEEFVLAYGAINYAHGWLDSCAALGLIKVHDDRVFTVDAKPQNRKRPLFICKANVGRSQMAEAFYNAWTHTQNASSAGIKDVRKEYTHPGNDVVKVMKEEGIDVSMKKVKPVTKKMIENNDIIVVMCEKEICPQIITSRKPIYWQIPDGKGTSEEKHREIRDMIKKKVREFISA